MKALRKGFALLLALAMVLSLSVTAFAAGNGSITIDNAVVGETYSIYRIFDLESFSDENPDNPADGQYAYKTNAKWSAFANQDTIKGVYVNVDAQGYVTWIEGADAEAFAKAAKAYADTNTIAPDADSVKATSTTVNFSGLDLGYYLVDTSLGSLCSLDTTNTSVTIKEKNEKPDISKEVLEDSTGTYGETNTADIGQVVSFQATITAKKGAQNYVVHDQMSDGLTFKEVKDVRLNGNVIPAYNYTVTSTGLTDECDFELAFNQDFLDKLFDNDQLVVTYTATVNDAAVIGGDGNPNKVKLDYGDNSETSWDQTITYVYELNVFKYASTGVGTDDIPLAGAEFILYKTVTVNDRTFTYYAQIVSGKLTGWTENEAEATTLTTDETGFIYIDGLDADTYYLKETQAPDGYNKLAEPVEITISEDGTVGTKVDNVDHTVKVLNQFGSELPSTGGIGTTIFYVVGGLLMVLAVVLLVTKKRMTNVE